MYKFIMIDTRHTPKFDYEEFRKKFMKHFGGPEDWDVWLEDDATDYVENMEETLNTVRSAMKNDDRSLRPHD